MKLRLDTNQMAGVQCECGAWDLLEDIAICVSSWRSRSLNKNELWTPWLFQVLKDESVKVLHSICQKIGKTQQWARDWKGQFSFNAKICSHYQAVLLISHASKVILKILQSRLQQYVKCELPDVQAGFRKGRGTRDQNANIHWSSKKQESSRKTSTSALLIAPKPLTVRSQQTVENS